ncbi:hypothetical protein [uncultured Parabacteroides sp.]|nr:hypothetical protein [uncultured Parabacteroides sp.]
MADVSFYLQLHLPSVTSIAGKVYLLIARQLPVKSGETNTKVVTQ